MPELRSETMTVNMGPQHPSTHGVLRLVLELSGETVVNADTTIGFLHTGIEKTAEQKKWQQVIPLVERMDYLGAQSNSLAFCLVGRAAARRRTMPERVKDIRVLIAELQRIASHLVWLGTHAPRDRRGLGDDVLLPRAGAAAQHQRDARRLPDVPELHPDRRPARGPADRVPRRGQRRSSTSSPSKLDEYEDLLTKNQIWLKRTQGRRRADSRRTRIGYGLVGPMARAVGVSYDVRKAVPVSRLRDLRLRRADRRPTATSTTATWCASRRCAQSTRIAQQALARITPRGVFDIQDYRIVPPPKDKVYTEMEALIQHFLIYSQGFTVPAGEAYVPVEGPRGEHGFTIVSDGTNRPYRIKLRAPSFYACQALPKMIVGGMIADVIAVIGSTDVVMGDVDR